MWSLAVNILTSFIHHEPTSYQVIAEAGLSHAFLEAITQTPIDEAGDTSAAAQNDPPLTAIGLQELEKLPIYSRVGVPSDQKRGVAKQGPAPWAAGILPSGEAITAIPQAFGAICLAETGMKLFQKSSALSSFFELFLSAEHLKALNSDAGGYLTQVGNSFDELVRHHPSLKREVMKCVLDMVASVDLVNNLKARLGIFGNGLLVEDANGEPALAGGAEARSGIGFLHEHASLDVGQDMSNMSVRPRREATDGPLNTQTHISVVSRFLSGFFNNTNCAAAFAETYGLEYILDLHMPPSAPYLFHEPHGPGHDSERVVSNLVGLKPHLALPAIMKRLLLALERLEPLLRHTGPEGFFAPWTKPFSPSVANDHKMRGTEFARALFAVYALCNALTTALNHHMYGHHRSAQNLFTSVNFADVHARVVDGLGRLHRCCVWEEILLQNAMPADWEQETRIRSHGSGNDETDNILRVNQSSEEPAADLASVMTDDLPSSAQGPEHTAKPGISSTQRGVYYINTGVLRYLLSKIPMAIDPFFHALGKIALYRARHRFVHETKCRHRRRPACKSVH